MGGSGKYNHQILTPAPPPPHSTKKRRGCELDCLSEVALASRAHCLRFGQGKVLQGTGDQLPLSLQLLRRRKGRAEVPRQEELKFSTTEVKPLGALEEDFVQRSYQG